MLRMQTIFDYACAHGWLLVEETDREWHLRYHEPLDDGEELDMPLPKQDRAPRAMMRTEAALRTLADFAEMPVYKLVAVLAAEQVRQQVLQENAITEPRGICGD